MKIGLFGYPGDHLERTKALCRALQQRGAETLVCLGGLVWGGEPGEEQERSGAVLRWLRAYDIQTLANESDRQVCSWRLKDISQITSFVQPRVRALLDVLTREEAAWLLERPAALPIENILCCADFLASGAQYPVPLTPVNAKRLFTELAQKAAFFPTTNGPAMLVRQQPDGALHPARYNDLDEKLDAVKIGALIGGVSGHPPMNDGVCWGAVVDSQATSLSLLCLDNKTFDSVPEKAKRLLQTARISWQE